MRMALALAARSLGRVAPNPAVGAVLVREGRVLGRGVTGDGGRPHAEAVALDQARARHGARALRGATAYVTLEPCNHHGRTPPCAEALVAAGIARVVCPLEDPDPRVSGRGLAALARAGVAVTSGVLRHEARRLNAGFLSRIERGRPHVTLKLAATLDGRIATRAGESRWITGPEARARVHLMRARADAVLIGAGTARADDPMLDVRGLGPLAAQPLRVVADGSLTLAPDSRLARTARDIPVLLLHRPDAPAARREALAALGVGTVAVAPGQDALLDDGLLDLAEALRALARADVTRLLCEGGGRLAASLLAAGLADEIALFTAGKAIGGDGRPVLEALGLDRLADAPAFDLAELETAGDDVLSLWRRPEAC
ncbi:MAG TPA: bifunctional diaminohydroxyphosphoribosylaminopyrimidine deaminase/5-amino-6-(5-phosphoribosylamino)uracil reductase RibD [Thermohalobaculum sp.]|nr:bifunctional diaminohydroxyphosphoribosylaminopyrimidine deaminase/5-amino-6-(5-phosphoribosylamino)uracil reductase RibD [Thermohalobaculum sp.]